MAEFKLGRIKFVYQGSWASTRAYVVDDVVSVGGKAYICVISHTSSALFATDLAGVPGVTKWNIVSDGLQWRGDWEETTYYQLGDLVKYGGIVYTCITSHTSATYISPTYLGLENDQSKWTEFATSFNWQGPWSTSTRYRVRDIVSYGGQTFICNEKHISNASATSVSGGLEADQGKWDTFNAGIDYKGVWSGSSVRYKINDVVTYGANLYICTTIHESTGSELDATKFSIFVNGLEFENSWTGGDTYQIGDLVTYGGNTYVALQNHSASQTPSTATSFWRPFTTGFNFRGDWNGSTDYQISDVVRVGGYSYLALVDNRIQTITATSTIVSTDPTRPNQIVTSDNTNVLSVNLPISFNTTFGGITSGTTYYVKTIVDSTHFTISTSAGGTVFALTATTAQTVTATTNPSPPFSTYWARLNSGLRWNPTNRTYTGISGTNISSAGSLATFDVTVTGTAYSVVKNAGGGSYAINDTIKILGTDVGGISPANDIIITVTGVNTTAITTVSSTGFAVTWTSGTSYVLGDAVYFGANTYLCILAHVGTSGNRPDADTTATYWNLLASGAESSSLTTQGDIFFYGTNGAQRLPIGTDGQILRVSDNAPAWLYYGQINNLIYVAPTGVDALGLGQGITIDKPWKTVNFACQQIEKGYLNPNATALLEKNKQFVIKEINNYVLNRYTVTVSGTTISTDGVKPNQITCTSTANLYVNMPIVFTTTAGGIVAGTVYYVKTIVDSTNFTITATSNGAEFNLTSTTSTANSGTYYYSASKTERDAGIIYDALVYDLGHNGNLNTTKATLAFFNSAGTGYVSGVETYDITAFVSAQNYMNALIINVLNNTAPSSNYQALNGISLGNRATQIIDNTLTAEASAAGTVSTLIAIITRGLLGGTTSYVPAAVQPNTTISVKTGTYDEILPIVLPRNTAIVGDELRSTTIQPSQANPNLVNDKSRSLAAMTRIRTIVPDIIANTTVTATSTGTNPNTQTQVTTLTAGDVGSTAAAYSVITNVGIVKDIIANGLSQVPTFSLPTVTGYNTSFLSTYGDGKNQIVQNYNFIKAEIAAFLNVNYSSVWTTFGSTNQMESLRDIGFVLDGLQYDMTYGCNTQSLINGSAYYSLGILQIRSAYLQATLGALTRLKTIIGQIVQGSSVSVTAGNTVTQYTTAPVGNAGSATFAQARVQDVIDWINNAAPNATIAPTAAIALCSSALQTSYNALVAARTEIASDAQQWVYKFYHASNISSSLTNRDAGLIVDALANDLIFGSNFNSLSAGRAYQRLNTSAQALVNNVNDESNATLGSLNFISYKASKIAAAGSAVQTQLNLDDVINSLSGTISTTLTTATTSTNLLTVTSTTGMLVDMPISFSGLPAQTTTTATTTTASGGLITLGATVSSLGIAVGQQIYFTGVVFGNIVGYQKYYVKTASASSITISLTNGGSALTLVDGSGTMSVYVNNAGGLVNGKTYWINSVASATTLTVTESFRSGTAFAVNNTVGSMTATVSANSAPETTGTITYNNTLTTIRGAEVLRANINFIAYEAAAHVASIYGGTVTSTTASNDRFTTGTPHNLLPGDPVVFSGTVITGSNVTAGVQYWVLTTPTTSSITIGTTSNATIPVDISSDGTGSMSVTYYYNLAKCVRDTTSYINALVYDLNFTGNYKSLRATQQYKNAVSGSVTSDMFLVRNGSGIRNITMNGLTGVLSSPNSFGTRRPTAGAYASLDPGFGPNDSNAWIDTRSCYTQNCTMFGYACTGAKIDGALHAGGNRSMVANDYTTIIGDGIGVWCTGSNSLTELVSVFNYYGYAGYLSELGARIRATNGNSSYGTYGVIAEGVDTYETPITGTVTNRYFQAYITTVVTDAINQVLRFEYNNAGSNYTNTVHTISGSGYNATALGDEFRDAAVFETRLLSSGSNTGGTSYVSNANTSQGINTSIGLVGNIVLAATDTLLSNAYNGMRIQITAGSGVGQYANILTYNNGSKVATVVKDSFTNLTVTGSDAGANTLTVASTATLYANMPIYLGTAIGGLSANTLYYVRGISSGTAFTVSLTSGGTVEDVTGTTSGQTVTLYAAGWDHVIPGYTITNTLDLTSVYITEPRISYTSPGYTATARTLPTPATWSAVKYASGNYVAIASGSTTTAYSVSGKIWAAGGAMPSSQSWADVTYGGGAGATAVATVGGLGGNGATFTATIGTGAQATQITSISVVSGGYGYSTPPVISITGGSGAGATATCTILNGTIQSVTITVNGSGYTSQPTITAVTNQITVITPTAWGRDYFSTPTVTVGAPFSATVWTSGGTGVTAGSYYSYNDAGTTNYYLASGVGTTFGATAPTHTTGGVTNGTDITLTYAGTLATATATLTNYGVSSYTVTNNGSGYTSAPTISVVDSTAKFVAISSASNNSAYQTVAGLATTWTAGGSTGKTNLTAVTYGNGVYVAVGGASGTASAVSSTDGSTWIDRSSTISALSAGNYSAVTYGNGYFIAIQTGGQVTSYSANGVTWTAGGTLPSSTTWTSVAYGNGRFVALAVSGAVAYSYDIGLSWVAAPTCAGASTSVLSSSYTWTKVAYGQGLFMAVANGSVWATSPDGVNWTTQNAPSSSNWKSVVFGNPVSSTLGYQPLWVAVSNTSGQVGASVRTGATTLGRMKVASGSVTEIRTIEPGSGYPEGNVTATTTSTNVITVDDTTNLVANQPVEFIGCSTSGLSENVTYYVIAGSIVSNTSFKVSATSGSSTAIVLSTTTLTGVYRAMPVVTQTDPNKVTTALVRVRTSDGVLGNPSFGNRGTNNATATATTTGDGYADIYQNTAYLNMEGLFTPPTPGANVQFASIPNTWYKLVAVTNVLGTPGNYSMQFQLNPALTTELAPSHGDSITTRLKYSQVRLTGHDFLYIGTGNKTQTNYPYVNPTSAIQANQQLASGGGRVFFTSTDQDGNFNVGNLFGVQQATGTATLNASAFNLAGLQSLQLGAVSIGVGSAVITQFSTDPYFTANSDGVIPTQKAIKSYIASQIGGGQSVLNVNTITSGQIYIANNTITTTTGSQIKVTARMNFVGGIDGAPVALSFFGQK